jgi:hypothetical protein
MAPPRAAHKRLIKADPESVLRACRSHWYGWFILAAAPHWK